MSDRTVTFEANLDKGIGFLCQSWIEGSSEDGIEFDLVCGAGLGTPLLRLTVEVDGQRITETVDIRDGLTDWVNRLVAEVRAE